MVWTLETTATIAAVWTVYPGAFGNPIESVYPIPISATNGRIGVLPLSYCTCLSIVTLTSKVQCPRLITAIMGPYTKKILDFNSEKFSLNIFLINELTSLGVNLSGRVQAYSARLAFPPYK